MKRARWGRIRVCRASRLAEAMISHGIDFAVAVLAKTACGHAFVERMDVPIADFAGAISQWGPGTEKLFQR